MKHQYITFFISLFILASCGKDDLEEIETIFGTWKVDSGFVEDATHINISTDSILTIYSSTAGYKNLSKSLISTVSDDSIVIEDTYTIKYQLLDGRLFTDALNEDLMAGEFSRDNSFGIDKWAKSVTPANGFELPEGIDAYDIGFSLDDNEFYCADRYVTTITSQLYRISTSGEILSTKDISVFPRAVEYTPFGIVTADRNSSQISLIDTSDGHVLDISSTIAPSITGIAYEPGTSNIYCASSNGDKIYKYTAPILEPEAVSEVGSIGVDPDGMHFYDDHLYIVSRQFIYKVSLPNLTVAETYLVSLENKERILGITRDADKFWLSISKSGTDPLKFYFKPIVLD